MRLAKALIRLCVCAGWSEPLLVAQTKFLEISCTGSNFINVTVLLKSVHAIRQCLDKGPFSKMTSFSLENEYLALV